MRIFSTSKEENKSSTVVGYTISSGKKEINGNLPLLLLVNTSNSRRVCWKQSVYVRAGWGLGGGGALSYSTQKLKDTFPLAEVEL